MSRGPGYIQRHLVAMLRRHGKPMTFADMQRQVLRDVGAPPGNVLRVSVQRSIRRALHRLVRDQGLIAIGDGGRGDPLRYALHPMLMAFMGYDNDSEEAKAMLAAVEEGERRGSMVRGMFTGKEGD
jgi:hypothetical protein